MTTIVETSIPCSPESHQPKYEALAEIRFHSARINSLAMAIELFDIALIQSIAIRSSDSRAALTAAEQRLRAILDGQVPA